MGGPGSCVTRGPRTLLPRPLSYKALRPVRLDLVPLGENAPAKDRIGVPERARRLETVDGDQHLLDLRPIAVQRHRIAPRRPGIAEANDAADVCKPERRFDDG